MGYASVIGFVMLSMAIIMGVMCVSGFVAKYVGQYVGFATFILLLISALYFLYKLSKRIVLSYINSRCVEATTS